MTPEEARTFVVLAARRLYVALRKGPAYVASTMNAEGQQAMYDLNNACAALDAAERAERAPPSRTVRKLRLVK